MAQSRDRRVVFWILGGMIALIVAFSIFSPANDDSNPFPTTYNNGSAGTKAAYLLLGELGYGVRRWEAPSVDLKNVDAAKTTLILAEPNFPTKGSKEVQADIADFLSRGGRVLATGKEGAYFLPGAKTDAPTRLYGKLCFSTPEGTGCTRSIGQGLALGQCSLDGAWAGVSRVATLRKRRGRRQLSTRRGRGNLVEFADADVQSRSERRREFEACACQCGRCGQDGAL